MRCLSITTIVLLLATHAAAAELQFRPRCRPRGTVVTMGDVAEITGAAPQEAQALAAVELFPAPAPGMQRTLRVREIEDLLVYRSINLAKHQFSGASQVVIAGDATVHAGGAKTLSAPIVKRAERIVRETLVQYLREKAGEDEPWAVKVRLNDEQVRAVPLEVRRIAAAGGEAPWVGTQEFELTLDLGGRTQRIVVEAEVSKRPPIVVAAASIPRGAVIRESDVTLQAAPDGDDRVEAAHALEDVVGREAVRAMAAGAVVAPQSIRSPLLVRRGEVVTVYSRNGGIVVRTTARAKEDGGEGDPITVESILDRKIYTAKVSGVQEVEVFGRAMRARVDSNVSSNASGRPVRDVARNTSSR